MAQFNYQIAITGDCSNTGVGSISILPNGGTPPYTVEWINPNLGVDVVSVIPSTRTNLFPGTYGLRLNDSTIPINNEFYVNIPVSDGVCASIVNVLNTTCGLNNGSVTGTSTSDYSSTNFYLYLSTGTYVTSASTNTSFIVFNDLAPNIYYIVAQDLGGCTGRTADFVVQSSTALDYGFYVVPNSSCGGTPIGKIYVTGQTGTAPYTYNWSNGATGSTVTGLTSGIYSVTVQDAFGCNLTKTTTVTDVDPVGFGVFTVTQPTCFQQDGTITLTITGGTAPFYYSASTGDVTISYLRDFTITNLGPGPYGFEVTDAGLCKMFASTILISPQGMSSVQINAVNSFCSASDGIIQVAVQGGSAPYTYTLIYPNGNTLVKAGAQQTETFIGLASGTYGVAVQDNDACVYFQQVTVIAQNSFTISTSTTGTTCGNSNGTVYVTKTVGGEPPFEFAIDGQQSTSVPESTPVTFPNLSSGTHVVTVTDSIGCVQTKTVYVNPSSALNFSLYSTSCGNGNSGKITAFISAGEPPFTFNWSNNVAGNPQQITASALTAGTYSLTVVDSNGCSLQRSTIITCDQAYASYQLYVMGEENFQVQSGTKLGLIQMLNEGYSDLTVGNVGCNLISATLTARVTVQPSGYIANNTFYTSTSLIDVPSDNVWYNTIQSMLEAIPGVTQVTVDPLTNQLTIQTDVNSSLVGQQIMVELIINYNITCQS